MESKIPLLIQFITHPTGVYHSINKSILSEGVLAKTLRFIGQTSHNRFCLRTEIYGVKLKPGKRFLLIITAGEGIPKHNA